MNIGSDYLLVRAIQRRRLMRMLSVALVATGMTLLLASGSYFAYAQYARSRLNDLVYQGPAASDESDIALPGLNVPLEEAPGPLFIPAARFATLYPGQGIHPKYWTNPLWAETPDTTALEALLAGFRPIRPGDLAPVGTLPSVTRIQIPSIGLDATVQELELLNLGNAFAWETPKNVVGHIPSTANVGEAGRGYLFGHLESPVRGEGSVFRRLPEVPQLLREGEEVYVILSREDGVSYLYKVFPWESGKGTELVYKDDLVLAKGDGPVITLVTCVPRLVYSHRLLVNAEPVGVQGL